MHMRLSLIALVAISIASPSFSAEPKTKAAVIATDDSWLAAEISGNVAFLNDLLLPDYVSIGPDGKRHTREQIIGHSKSRTADERAKFAEQVKSWKAKHPARVEVSMAGDTAVLKWVSAGADAAVLSCDIFTYSNGGWHAIYSQHTTAVN